MGLNGESGEIIDMLKKNMFQGHELDKEHIAKELSDCLWYIAVAAEGIGHKLDDIAEMNVEKLRKRYPDGFLTERSVNREKGIFDLWEKISVVMLVDGVTVMNWVI